MYHCESFDHHFACSHISLYCHVYITAYRIACVCITCDTTEVVDADANRAFVDTTADGDRPVTGNRKVETWSMCFQGGTFDRVKERCVSLSSDNVYVPCTIAAPIDVADHPHSFVNVHCIASLTHLVYIVACGMCIDRCSGDFSQSKATKYNMNLPPLSAKVIAETLAGDITEAERAVAAQPGMFGRIWFGQALAFDEAYQILQELLVQLHISCIVAYL